METFLKPQPNTLRQVNANQNLLETCVSSCHGHVVLEITAQFWYRYQFAALSGTSCCQWSRWFPWESPVRHPRRSYFTRLSCYSYPFATLSGTLCWQLRIPTLRIPSPSPLRFVSWRAKIHRLLFRQVAQILTTCPVGSLQRLPILLPLSLRLPIRTSCRQPSCWSSPWELLLRHPSALCGGSPSINQLFHQMARILTACSFHLGKCIQAYRLDMKPREWGYIIFLSSKIPDSISE